MENKERLIEEFLKQAKDSGERIDEIVCKACGEPEAFTYKNFPFVVYCPRMNNCGKATKSKDYFPELVVNYNPTPEERQKSLEERAKHYATVERGVHDYEKLGGEYCTLTLDDKEYAALRFRLEDGETFNYRVIDHPKRKSHFDSGKQVKDLLFIPKQVFTGNEIWVAESPLKAMALVSAGINAVGLTSTSTSLKDSKFFKENEDKYWVMALDNDDAGKKAATKWLNYGINEHEALICKAAIPPHPGTDWDDYLKAGILNKMIPRAKVLGEIFCCEFDDNPLEEVESFYLKSVALADKPSWFPLIFELNGCLWKMWHLDTRKGPKIKKQMILNGVIRPGYNYSKGDELNTETYTIGKVICSNSGKQYWFKLNAEERISPTAFRRKISDVSLLQFTPDPQALDFIVNNYLRVTKTPTVRHVERSGFHPESGCYVFPNFVIDKKGKIVKPNALGFFPKVNLHMSKDLIPKAFKPDMKNHYSHHEFLRLVHKAWGTNGVILMAYYISTYFSYLKCSGIDGTFPFISFEGAPGTGKSTLISLLNMAFNFFSGEGRPINKTDTKKGVTRDLAKYSSLCLPLLENRKEKTGYDIMSEDTFLNLYGRNSAQTTAIKSMDFETRSIPFDAGLVVVWNHNTFITKEVRDRFINLKVQVEPGKPKFSKENQEAKDKLREVGKVVSSVGLDVLRNRNKFELHYLKKIDSYKQEFQDEGLEDVRYQDNFAHLAAALDIYEDVFLKAGTPEEQEESAKIIRTTLIQIEALAKKQCKETLGDAGLVLEFWEAFQQKLTQNMNEPYASTLDKGEHYVEDSGVLYIRPKKVFKDIGWDKQDIDEVKYHLQRSHLFRGAKSKRHGDWQVAEGQSPVFHTWSFEMPFEKNILQGVK